MVIFDTNILVAYVTDAEGSNKLVGLFDDLRKNKEIIGIPTPVLAEFLTYSDYAELTKIFGKKRSLRILDYREAEAIETAEISKLLGKDNQESWQKVKFDRQILATAKVNNARVIYTDDRKMMKDAAKLGVKAISIEDLP